MSADPEQQISRLIESAPHLQQALVSGALPPRKFHPSEVRCETLMVTMRDGIRLATDIYLPPVEKGPVVVVRTPYDRVREERSNVAANLALACRGYVVVVQDCRGTGQSEPDSWDCFIYEPEDGYDCVDWIVRQSWYGGFIGSYGGSYVGQVQWSMAAHPAMSAIIPQVSGLGLGICTARLHMFVNICAKIVSQGEGKVTFDFNELEHRMVEETLSTGFFNDPIELALSSRLKERFPELQDLPVKEAQERLWAHFCALDCAGRAKFLHEAFDIREVSLVEIGNSAQLFGQHISPDRHTLPNTSATEMVASINAPPLLRTGWYDWFFNDALETFRQMRVHGQPDVASRTRMIIAPTSHNTYGYKEGLADHPELSISANALDNVGMFINWYEAVRDDKVADWPTVIYYLMGENVWCAAQDWPPPESRLSRLYISADGGLSDRAPDAPAKPTTYRYDPMDPAPTLGGNLVSAVIPPGSVDVTSAQERPDVITFTSPELAENVDIVGPLKMILHASSSAVDTDFVVRLTDVFPDGRAIQLQNGILRARYRDLPEAPSLLEPGKVYEFEIDMWATANRFKAGHRIRVDISSADFPHYDRNTNTGGLSETPIVATQTLYHDAERPSHLAFSVIGDGPKWAAG